MGVVVLHVMFGSLDLFISPVVSKVLQYFMLRMLSDVLQLCYRHVICHIPLSSFATIL